MSARCAGLPLEEQDLVEDAEDLVRIDRAERQVVVGVAAVVEVEAAEHVLVEQPRDDLLDVLRLDSGGRCRPAPCACGPAALRQQQRHAPVGDVGVIEGGLERLVLDQHALIGAERARARPRASSNQLLALADVRVPG